MLSNVASDKTEIIIAEERRIEELRINIVNK